MYSLTVDLSDCKLHVIFYFCVLKCHIVWFDIAPQSQSHRAWIVPCTHTHFKSTREWPLSTIGYNRCVLVCELCVLFCSFLFLYFVAVAVAVVVIVVVSIVLYAQFASSVKSQMRNTQTEYLCCWKPDFDWALTPRFKVYFVWYFATHRQACKQSIWAFYSHIQRILCMLKLIYELMQLVCRLPLQN